MKTRDLLANQVAVNVDEFYADGPGWTGIDTVLDQMLAAINQPVNLEKGVGFKLTASDARRHLAKGNIFHGLAPFSAPGMMYDSAWQLARPDTTPTSVATKLQGFEDERQRNAALVLMTNKQTGSGEDSRSYVIYPVSFVPQATRPYVLNPASWKYQVFSVESIFDQMDHLAETLRSFVDNECSLAAYSAKVAADERAQGAPWGYVFWNSTSVTSDLQYVDKPSSWVRLSWHVEHPEDPTIPNYFIDWLNGLPTPNGDRLTWAQACSSKILFTDREEGRTDGATLSMFYPRL